MINITHTMNFITCREEKWELGIYGTSIHLDLCLEGQIFQLKKRGRKTIHETI